MKCNKYFSYLIFMLCISVPVLLASCSTRSRSQWPSYGKDADSIIKHLDSVYQGEERLTQADIPTIDSMSRAVVTNNARIAKALDFYWRSLAVMTHNPDSALSLIERAASYCDSAEDSYLNARIKSAYLIINSTETQETYIDLRNLLGYYETIRDTSMIIRTYRSLSSFYLKIDDYKSFKECTQKIECLYWEQNNDSAILKNRLNYALYHILQNDSLKAAVIIKSLLKNPYARKDSLFMGRLYVDFAMLQHEPDSMLRAIEISSEFRNDLSKRYTLELAVAGMYNDNGNTSRCDSILSYLKSIIDTNGDEAARMKLYSILWMRCKARGDLQGALIALEKSRRYAEALQKRKRDAGIENYIHRDNVRRIDMQYEKEKYETRIRWIIIMFTGVIMATGAILWLRNRQKRAQLARAEAERELAYTGLRLEREQRSLLAMRMVITERDNLVKDVSEALDKMRKDGHITADGRKNVNLMVQTSQSMRRELDDFRTNFERVHPEFMKRLSTNYPGLTEGDLKLALYISAGLDTKQIAHLLHIRPDSVKKNRQRLRRHMNLDSTVSLEDTLRTLTHSSD